MNTKARVFRAVPRRASELQPRPAILLCVCRVSLTYGSEVPSTATDLTSDPDLWSSHDWLIQKSDSFIFCANFERFIHELFILASDSFMNESATHERVSNSWTSQQLMNESATRSWTSHEKHDSITCLSRTNRQHHKDGSGHLCRYADISPRKQPNNGLANFNFGSIP